MFWILIPSLALAAPPADLEELVALTLARDSQAAVLALEASAAQIRADSARRPMDPQVMLGVDALAPGHSGEETMLMVGVSQMLPGWGERQAIQARYAVDVARAGIEQERVAADLRLRLAQTAARIAAWKQEEALLQQQLEAAKALQAIGLARYGAGAAVSTPMGAMDTGMTSMAEGVPVRPPTVQRSSGGMSGMAGMDGMSGGSPRSGGMTGPMPGGMAEMGGSSGGMMMPGGGMGEAGLAALLRLDAQIAQIEAEQAGLRARLAGERAALAAYTGEEAAAALLAEPERYLEEADGGSGAPERRLARSEAEAAAADLEVARRARRPDVMLSAAERFMTDGMPAGTDLMVGVEVPLWGSRGGAIDAAQVDLAVAEARIVQLERDLAVAAAAARAARDAAQARAEALESVALPRAKAAFEATSGLVASGRASTDEAVRAWEAWLGVARQAVDAREEARLRAAELARLEGL